MIFVLFFTRITHGQDTVSVTDAKVKIKIEALKKEGISIYICFNMQCFGGLRLYYPDSCVARNIKYLIWAENGKSYKQRFDECIDYKVQIISNCLLSIVNGHYSELKKEAIKCPQYYDLISGKKELLTTYIDHSCVTNIIIYKGKEMMEKTIDNFAADTEYLDGHDKKRCHNINYQSNRATFLYRLYLLTRQL